METMAQKNLAFLISMKYILIHGTMWNPEENRFPRLKGKLEETWNDVYVPSFPTPEGQTIENWCKAMREQVPFAFDEETVLVGHSLWALYILHLLDRERVVPIHHAVLVSWFTTLLGNEEFDELNKDFYRKDFDRERIKTNAKKISIFHGDDDPYVPIEQAKDLEKRLWSELHLIKNGWHLNEAAWYREFQELWDICS